MMAKRGDGYSESSRWKPVARNEELRISLVEKRNRKESAGLPDESFTPNRIYATLRPDGQLKQIKVYDAKRQRAARLDFDRPHHGILPHKHMERVAKNTGRGYRPLNQLEKAYAEKVRKWLGTLKRR